MENSPIELPISFVGKGEVKGFSFKQIKRSNTAYLYEVSSTFGAKWYEVFKCKVNARFGNITYPKQKSFGISAWTCKTIERATEKFNELNKKGASNK